MKKNLSPFERDLRDKMDGYEMPYEHSAWAGQQLRMGLTKSVGSVWVVSLVTTILALTAASVTLYRHQHTSTVAQKADLRSRFANSITNTTKGTSHINSAWSVQPEAVFVQLSEMNPNENSTLRISATNQEGAPFVEAPILLDANETKSTNTFITAGTKPDNLIEFGCSVRKACRGEEVEFQTTNGPIHGSYLWNFGDGHFSDEANPKHKFGKAGDYDVSLSITSDNGKINTTVINDMITIQEAPDADFAWEFINANPTAPEVRIINLSEGGNSYEWSDGNESKVNPNGAIFLLKSSGRQMIALSAKNQAGCTDGAVKYISVNSDFTLNTPKQWSIASGLFMPDGLKKNNVDFVMSLFDNDGKNIFETSNRMKGWNGKLPDGSLASSGSSFTYKIIITNDLTKEQKYFNGSFNVFP